MAKPFVKWAGGKGKLLSTLEANLPLDFNKQQEVTYIEPFVGGGAMLFYMLEKYPNIRRIIINDINLGLINCYRTIKDNHKALISELTQLHNKFYELESIEEKRSLYYSLRDEYNMIPVDERNTIRTAALFVFFNRTCFNGLYRENNQGNFNVPYGKYVRPNICNEQVVTDAHNVLQHVEILHGNYANVLGLVDWNEYNFFYLDPPYRPLLKAKNFKQYTMNAFGDQEQEELKGFCDIINNHRGYFMLSNSNSILESGVNYFEDLYNRYNVQQINAPRRINAYAQGSQMATEILVKNYD